MTEIGTAVGTEPLGGEMQSDGDAVASALSAIEDLKQRIEAYSLFVYLLLELPNEELAANVLALDYGTGGVAEGDDTETRQGMALIDAYASANAGRAVSDVLQDLAVDRTRLLRGLTKQGPKPPYESLFVGTGGREANLALVQTYRQAGCKVASNVKDAPDHIAIEMSFMWELRERELASLESGDIEAAQAAHAEAAHFMEIHLGGWGMRFAEEMFSKATTDFYRGIAHMLKGFLEDEAASLVEEG